MAYHTADLCFILSMVFLNTCVHVCNTGTGFTEILLYIYVYILGTISVSVLFLLFVGRVFVCILYNSEMFHI